MNWAVVILGIAGIICCAASFVALFWAKRRDKEITNISVSQELE